MNDTEKEVVWCINSSVSLIPLFSVSLSLLTHTQAQSERSGLFYSRGNMKHPEAFVGAQLHDLALHFKLPNPPASLTPPPPHPRHAAEV